MTTRVTDGLASLTEREKQTLRLIVRGHDAKSIARHLDLSVHTINERLRDARRKLAVPSSRAAARLLLDQEGLVPKSVGDNEIGDVSSAARVPSTEVPDASGRRNRRLAWITIGGTAMLATLGLLVLATQAPLAPTIGLEPTAASVVADPADAEVEAAARQWLALLDQGRWDDSWAATGAAFRKLNTSRVWAAASEKVRAPLGAVVSRTFISHEELPAPPRGYDVVKFRTSFANKADAVETVTLNREGGSWRVVGITVG